MRLEMSLVLCGVVFLVRLGAAAEAPVAASPGDPDGALIGDPCPTFSWGGLAGATSHELVVYRLGEAGRKADLVLQKSFAGSVQAWTPSLDACLVRGGRYAWTVRAIGPEGESEWSIPSLFEVVAGPNASEFARDESVADRLPKGEVGRIDGAPLLTGKAQRSGLPAALGGPIVAGSAAGPTPLAASGGDPALQVNGSPVVTLASNLYAVVAANGTLLHGAHVRGVTRFSAGLYDVAFDRSVNSCAHTATIGAVSPEVGGLIDTANFVGPNVVTVFTQSPDGAPPPLSDRGFHLIVTCSALSP